MGTSPRKINSAAPVRFREERPSGAPATTGRCQPPSQLFRGLLYLSETAWPETTERRARALEALDPLAATHESEALCTRRGHLNLPEEA